MAIEEFISGREGCAGLASSVLGDFVRPHQPGLRPSVALPRTAADFFVTGRTDPRVLFLVSADEFRYRIDHLQRCADGLQGLLLRGFPGCASGVDAALLLDDIGRLGHLNKQLRTASSFLNLGEVRGWFRMGYASPELAAARLERSPYKGQFKEVLGISRELVELLQTRHGIAIAADAFSSPRKETVFLNLYRGLRTALGKTPCLAAGLIVGAVLIVRVS